MPRKPPALTWFGATTIVPPIARSIAFASASIVGTSLAGTLLVSGSKRKPALARLPRKLRVTSAAKAAFEKRCVPGSATALTLSGHCISAM